MQIHYMPSSMLTLVFSLLCAPIANALILPTLPTLPSLSNLTFPPTTNLSVQTIKACVHSPEWSPQREIASACDTALQLLIDESHTWGDLPGHFLYNKGRSYAHFPSTSKTLALPKRYVSGDCTVAIVMMKMFEYKAWQIPGLPIGRWPVEDQVRVKDLVEPVDYVRATCHNGCGYAVVGEKMGVVVTVWGTNSVWDRFVRGMKALGDGDDAVG